MRSPFHTSLLVQYSFFVGLTNPFTFLLFPLDVIFCALEWHGKCSDVYITKRVFKDNLLIFGHYFQNFYLDKK